MYAVERLKKMVKNKLTQEALELGVHVGRELETVLVQQLIVRPQLRVKREDRIG